MGSKARRVIAAAAVAVALIVGMLAGSAGVGRAEPVLPEDFRAEVFAPVLIPVHLSFDSEGNLFVGGSWASEHAFVRRVSADGSTVETFGAKLADSDGVIVDVNGALGVPGAVLVGCAGYFVDSWRGAIAQITPDGQNQSYLFEMWGTNIQQLAFDSRGRLLFASASDRLDPWERGGVWQFKNGTGSLLALGKTYCGGIAVDGQDRIFVSAYYESVVKLLAPDGTVLDPQFATGLRGPDALALDTRGQFGGALYVSERAPGALAIARINPATGEKRPFAENVDAMGLAFGPDGDLFVSEFSTNIIWRISSHLEVTIDIKPGSYLNFINPRSNGIIAVAILTTAQFDATTVDPLSVRFGPNRARVCYGQSYTRDVDRDGDVDLVLHFKTEETGIKPGDTEAGLTGETFAGLTITGTNSICTVGGEAKTVALAPDSPGLSQNVPNPFNPTTRITYRLAEAGETSLVVYNLIGQPIRVLVRGYQEAGEHRVIWDGKDKQGRSASSGVYFCQLVSKEFVQARRMLLIR